MNATTLLKTDELINLEREVLEGRGTPSMFRRIERLKSKGEKARLGLLSKVLETYEFRDDVLHTARLRNSKYLAECVKDPQWATVEVLDLGWNKLKALGIGTSDFLDSMPLLHTLSLRAEELPERPCPGITALNVTGDLEIAVIAERFPGLTSIDLDYHRRPEELWEHPLAQQLESITLGGLTWAGDTLRLRTSGRSTSVEWITRGPALRRLELPEEHLLGEGECWHLQDLFDAARRKGAQVVLLPEPLPRPEWRRSRHHRWH